MAKGYSYVLATDSGFVPNPFYGVLTLATCKPVVRKVAQVGDYLIGVAPSRYGQRLSYMAKISEVVTFDEYWKDKRFRCKRPKMSQKNERFFGDNIYRHLKDGTWHQEPSLHYLGNVEKDTGRTDHVLICEEFFYFGCEMIALPEAFSRCIHKNQGHHNVDEKDCQELWSYLNEHYTQGMTALPRQYHDFLDKIENTCYQNSHTSTCYSYTCHPDGA